MTNHNGAVAEIEAEAMRIEKLMVPVDTTAPKTYRTKSGVVLTLRPISQVLIRRLSNNTFGKPQPPIVETEVGPKRVKTKAANPDDPDYKAALNEWAADHNERNLIYVFTHGVITEPPTEDAQRLQKFLPGDDDDGIKYAWLLELLQNDDEIGDLSNAIMGINTPTEKGISDAEERFQRDSERLPD